MELLICTVINVLDVLGVTAWGNTDISLQKKKIKKTDFLDFCFSKGEVDHSKQRAVCVPWGSYHVHGSISAPVATSRKVFP